MFVGRNYPFLQTINWTKKYILIFALISTVPVIIYWCTDYKQIVIPWLPISLIGIAVAFYLGFKNNASYDRLWEARKILGAITNSSRTMGMMVKGYVRRDFEVNPEIQLIQVRLIKRHIAWLHALRFQLRSSREWEHRIAESKNNKNVPVTEVKYHHY